MQTAIFAVAPRSISVIALKRPRSVQSPGAAVYPHATHNLIARLLTVVFSVLTAPALIAQPALAQPVQLSAFAQSTQLSALVTPSSSEHHVGKVVLVELITPDIAVAKQFYGALFGWRYRDLKVAGDTYAEATLDGQLVAGLVHRPVAVGARRQSTWLTFLAVRDVDATRALAVANGAKVLLAPHTVPNRGREAVFADPQGAVFGVLESGSGDPYDELPDHGEWIWSSLSTTDPEANAGFYQTLFDYDVFELPAEHGARHLLLASDNYARASANTLPANRPHSPPHWLNYIHVEDVAASSARVLALGGRVLVEARMDRHGGRVALVADPLGAPFGLLEWPDAQSKEITR